MRIGMVIERASGSEHKRFLSKATLMSKDKQLCSQARVVVVVCYKDCGKLLVSDCDELRHWLS